MTGKPWFEEAFRRHYLTVYAHRDDESAIAEAGFAVRALGTSKGSAVLDLACGAGRHARALAALGMSVTGVDLSRDLLEEAARRETPGIAYVRADMRRLPFVGVFDAVCQMFTSFGYFETDEEDLAALAEAGAALKPGGRLLLDYVNRERVLTGLVPEDIDSEGGYQIAQARSVTPDGRRVLKRVKLTAADGAVSEYTESVRLYPPEEMTGLLHRAGLEEEARYGDLAGSPFTAASERLVLVGRSAC
jgi:SAM-dependent methyltransferase